jgi:hypothetical protein
MPGIDVTELLTDPTFAETFTVIRSTKTIVAGRARLTPKRFPGIIGVVQPAGGLDLQRLPDGSNLTGAIVIWTKYLLTNGDLSEDLSADQVDWDGHFYTVMNVKDWSRYGAGFVNAVCQLATNKARTDGM